MPHGTRRRLPLFFVASALGLGGLLTTASPSSAYVAIPSPTVFISEIHYDNTGADAGEAVEVFGPAGTDLTGWSIVLYNGNGGASYGTTALSGTIPDLGGGFGVVVVNYPVNGLQNGSPDGLALVSPTGVVQFLSYEGTFAAVGGPADGLTSTDIGVSEAGSEPLGLSLQARLIPGSSTRTYAEHIWRGPQTATFGAVNPVDDAPPPPPPPPPVVTKIAAVQGSGAISPLLGQVVTVEAVVVADFEGAAPNLRGFYLQEEDADADADPTTSEGIFVFNGSDNDVSIGQLVRVTGTVGEFQGQTQISNTTAIEVVTSAVAAPTPAAVTFPLAAPDALEAVEGMIVTVPETMYVTEHFQLGRFGQVVVSSDDRLDQPTAVAAPGAPANALQAANGLRRLIIDDALNNQNPDPIHFGRGGQPLSAANTLRGGDTLTGATGILTYTWAGNSASGNAYRLRPVSPAEAPSAFEFVAANPRPTTAPEVGGSLQVASFNVLNFFTTLADGNPDGCGPVGAEQNCRGAFDVIEYERQVDKLVEAILALDADVLGLVEVENSELADGTPVDPLATLVDELNAVAGPGTYDRIDTGTVGTDTIRVGYLYRPSAAAPLGDHAVLDSSVDPRFDDARNRPSVAQSFVENATGEVVTVTVNHFKSKGSCPSSSTDPNADQGDGQGCWNLVRTAAAEALVDWLADDPTDVGDTDHLVIGDLNAYAMENPIQVLADAGYVDLAETFVGPDTYSYVFDGQWGSLDYVFASPSLATQVTGAGVHHINADEPSVLDYNTNFKSAGQIDSLFAPDQYRTSDHDPLLVGLALDAGDLEVTTSAPRLWPPNHRLRTVDLTATVDGASASVTIIGATSSEADSGLGDDDLPGDIVLVDADTVELRAERFSRPGRTYTVTAQATVAAPDSLERQTLVGVTTVLVPHDQRPR